MGLLSGGWKDSAVSETERLLRDIQETVTRTETLMSTLIGPDGRITLLENDVRELREYRTSAQATVKTTATVWGVVAGTIGLVGHILWDSFKSK